MKRKTYKREYEVESIIDRRFDEQAKSYLYQIKWKGYPHSQNTWEPIEHLQNPHVKTMVKEFDSAQEIGSSKKQINLELLKQCLLRKLTEFLFKNAPQENDLQEIILSDFDMSSNENNSNYIMPNFKEDTKQSNKKTHQLFQNAINSLNSNS
ncbi:unnamed protein product (macronuclear) [Paramecium tetraurelia]|uniref:Chromo domain-containing protein n=1 Tax=Paramecium tetraurelia TaxID=5888 RepID=A0ECZ5_PARTE|nr:uncharacterized protein GSPATT00004031001 [Paramecium tetraurelia]CAK93162.1 unnamed protein product [Paramecium tetraurelia]|eukprot:XP_001460559.1 hypothetical protein (macronuclear) [Paramecium tetraurelia strain d4-2]